MVIGMSRGGGGGMRRGGGGREGGVRRRDVDARRGDGCWHSSLPAVLVWLVDGMWDERDEWDGWMDGWMDGWLDGWMDERSEVR